MARSQFTSWRDWAHGIGVGFEQQTEGRGNCWDEIEREFANPESPWSTLPWDLDLLPPLQRFAVGIGAPITRLDGGDPRWFGGCAVTVASAAQVGERCRLVLQERYGLADRAALVTMVQQLMHDPTDRALPLARIATLRDLAQTIRARAA